MATDEGSDPSDHLFTLEEVNELIPRLETIMQRLQNHGRAVQAALEELEGEGFPKPDQPLVGQLLALRPDLQNDLVAMEKGVAEIENLGGEFKGLDLGLVDFRGELGGRVVYLCWQYGETEVSHYHGLQEGFAGRKPIEVAVRPARYLQ